MSSPSPTISPTTGGIVLRADFDTHPLWEVLRTIDAQLEQIVDDHQPDELADIERIKVQLAYVRSFDAVASTRAAFFHPVMLDNVQGVWNQVNNDLTNRVANGIGFASFVSQAAADAETALLQMAPWPRAYGKGGEVKQMDTLFEQLLEAQRTSIAALEAEHVRLREEIRAYEGQIDGKRTEVDESLEATGTKLTELNSTIEEQKEEVAEAVESAAAAVTALTAQNDEAYKEWRAARESEFGVDFNPLRDQISEKLASADLEYAELLGAKEKYTKLVSAIAADEVAAQFETEAAWGRKLGNRFYLLGFALLVLAAVPLVLLIFEDSRTTTGTVDWTAIIVRLAIGVLAGSAATVAIRLGGRLINNANAIKRMELELRAIGPFLANVADKTKVDTAFIDLVAKAFGNSYAETASTGGKDAQEESTPVTAASQVMDLIEKARQIAPTPH
jgi:hypothetical protein